MKKAIKIRNVIIGQGLPKICVPITGKDISEIIQDAYFAKKMNPDIVEWRGDYFSEFTNIESVKKGLKAIRKIFIDIPIIFTFRSGKEGGNVNVDTKYYIEINKAIIETELADIIDVELFTGDENVINLINAAHKSGTAVIVSNHDINSTPKKEEIVARLCKAQKLGSDISKIAVMPRCAEDVIILLDATRIMNERYAIRPISTMSMSQKGIISRISGEVFGSDLTFGSGLKASAPGQISAVELREIMELLHDNN